ncbi:hypothetical protein METP3_01222 [Methanosarcinales archaeon]|nr:MAG: hypothetical protein OI861_00190 [Candidatus Methanoperedens sp.]CAG0967263.1 hypothetical protein METP3_01222 [Methanosarcinales archaeon]
MRPHAVSKKKYPSPFRLPALMRGMTAVGVMVALQFGATFTPQTAFEKGGKQVTDSLLGANEIQ